MSGPSLHIGLPSWDLFKFPPDPAPPALPPPSHESTIAAPFTIPADVYNELLDVKYPLTIAAVYGVTVTLVNAYNRRRGNKPWAIAKTRPFHAFVILHNVFLAVYSATTFAAMWRAMRHVLPGLDSHHGLVDTVDALCKIQGPRGLGDAVTYNSNTNAWETRNKLIRLGLSGTPDPTDVGRLWNEGLAFWGWWFYLSKFYEVLDTFIILAKGKRSSTLQTYHHAGAMLCMWAGIRYMAPPIWIFCLFNSGIHAMMYTYYTISALRIRVPQAIKRTLTTLQISQFVLGATFAALHLFVYYTVPVSTPYKLVSTVTSIAAAATSTAASLASAAASAGMGAYLKKLAYRAAGEEGLAENVRDAQGHYFGPEADRIIETLKEETRWRDEYHRIPCIDTTGQAFAIWLNIIYLLPLTALFVRFFVRSYTRRSAPSTRHPTRHHRAAKAARDATHGVEREVESLGRAAEDEIAKGVDFAERKAGAFDAKGAKAELKQGKESAKGKLESEKDVLDRVAERVRAALAQAGEEGEAVVRRVKEKVTEKAKEGWKGEEALQAKVEEGLREMKEKVEEASPSASPSTSPKKKKKGKKGKKEAKDEVKDEGKDEQPETNGVKKEKDASTHAPEGLSTADPRSVGSSYAEIIKEEADEEHEAGEGVNGAREGEGDAEAEAEVDASTHAPGGLSTTDPKDEGVSFADKVKE